MNIWEVQELEIILVMYFNIIVEVDQEEMLIKYI